MTINNHTYLKAAWLVGVLILLNTTIAVTPAYATTITFTGTIGIIEIDDGSSAYSGLTVGDTFSGSITYGNSAADAAFIEIDLTSGLYEFSGAPYGGSVTAGSTVTAAEISEVEIGDNNDFGEDFERINNLFGAGSTTANTMTDAWSVLGDAAGPRGPLFFGVVLFSLDTSLYSGTDFQAFPPAIGETVFPLIFIGEEVDDGGLGEGGDVYLATGILTSITVDTDPAIGGGVVISGDAAIGDNAVIGDAVVVNKDVVLGDNNSVGDSTTINKEVLTGDNVKIGNNVFIAKKVTIEDGVTIGEASIVNKGAYLCSGATIGVAVTIGKNRLVDTDANVIDSSILPGSNTPPGQCTE